MKPEINLQLFAEQIKAKRGDITLRDAASQIGKVSATTLCRCEQAKLPDLNTFVRICRWLDVSTEAFVVHKIRVINAKATTEYFDERQKNHDQPEWMNEIVETVRREREQDQIESDRIMKEAFKPRPRIQRDEQNQWGNIAGGVVDSREEIWPEGAQIKSMYFIPNEPVDLPKADEVIVDEGITAHKLLALKRHQERILSQIKDDIENEGQPKLKHDNEDNFSMTPPYFHENEDQD